MTPQTLDRICEAFAQSCAFSGITGVGYRLCEDDDGCSFLHLFEAPMEWYGGKEDGASVYMGFNTTISDLLSLFEAVDQVQFDATLQDRTPFTGPCVMIDGKLAGERVTLIIWPEPPLDAEPPAGTDGPTFWQKSP